jgi:hypothetical protein
MVVMAEPQPRCCEAHPWPSGAAGRVVFAQAADLCGIPVWTMTANAEGRRDGRIPCSAARSSTGRWTRRFRNARSPASAGSPRSGGIPVPDRRPRPRRRQSRAARSSERGRPGSGVGSSPSPESKRARPRSQAAAPAGNSLHSAHDDFVRLNRRLRVTPIGAASDSAKPWTLEEPVGQISR